MLSKTQFYKHKRLYYNRRERKWNSDRILPENDHQDFEFGTGRDNEDLEKDFCFSDSNSEPEDAQHDKGQ